MTRISEPRPPVVVLTGFMGSGKTEVGRLLAERLGVEFIETDWLVETRAGMKVAEIFEQQGEKRAASRPFQGLARSLQRSSSA